jgi:ribosomal protein L7/L12
MPDRHGWAGRNSDGIDRAEAGQLEADVEEAGATVELK